MHDEQADVTRRYREGASLNALARMYDVHAPWLRHRLIKWNVPLRDPAEANRPQRLPTPK
ncbi:hypothetical protein [Streptomyces inusitatus]|uniref:hypothetical protein n=1 Tax=Streptomyces inusitatus TaxID=68221 RepID=UPI00167EEB43|nr:hypothetical protein [Streptomyces inusitatus]